MLPYPSHESMKLTYQLSALVFETRSSVRLSSAIDDEITHLLVRRVGTGYLDDYFKPNFSDFNTQTLLQVQIRCHIYSSPG